MQDYSAPLAGTLTRNEERIIDEMCSVQGEPVDTGGYYLADPEKVKKVMRCSETFNEALLATYPKAHG